MASCRSREREEMKLRNVKGRLYESCRVFIDQKSDLVSLEDSLKNKANSLGGSQKNVGEGGGKVGSQKNKGTRTKQGEEEA